MKELLKLNLILPWSFLTREMLCISRENMLPLLMYMSRLPQSQWGKMTLCLKRKAATTWVTALFEKQKD